VGKNPCLPWAYGPWEARIFARGLIYEGFSTLGMKKFPYLTNGLFGNPIFLHESIYVMATGNFHTFNHLVDSYRNTISKWAVCFRYGKFTLKLARGKKSLTSHEPMALGRQAFLPVG
jgi:hypothetical protein